MSTAQSATHQQQQQRTEDERGGRTAAVIQGVLILLALGLGGAGMVLPLDDAADVGQISMLIVTEDATEGCPGSGVLLLYGADENGDGMLSASERDGSTTVCDGARGSSGTPGADGLQVLMTSSTVPPGSACAEGGVAYAWGVDLDNNATLEGAEVLETTFLCHGTEGAPGTNGSPGLDGQNGSDGEDGQHGTTALITSELPDPGVCPVGLLLHIGLDDGLEAGDGVLQPDEVDETVRICATDLRTGPLSDLSPGSANSLTNGCDAMAHIGDDL